MVSASVLKEKAAYIIFKYPSTSFYIKTSFNPKICSVKLGYFYDIDTDKYVPKSLVQDVAMEVQLEEPVQLKQQSDFWKSILLEGYYA